MNFVLMRLSVHAFYLDKGVEVRGVNSFHSSNSY